MMGVKLIPRISKMQYHVTYTAPDGAMYYAGGFETLRKAEGFAKRAVQGQPRVFKRVCVWSGVVSAFADAVCKSTYNDK